MTIELSAGDHEGDPKDFFKEIISQGGGEVSYVTQSPDGSSSCVIIDNVSDIMSSMKIARDLGADFVGQEPLYLDKINKSYLFGIAPGNQTFVIMQEGNYKEDQSINDAQ